MQFPIGVGMYFYYARFKNYDNIQIHEASVFLFCHLIQNKQHYFTLRTLRIACFLGSTISQQEKVLILLMEGCCKVFL